MAPHPWLMRQSGVYYKLETEAEWPKYLRVRGKRGVEFKNRKHASLWTRNTEGGGRGYGQAGVSWSCRVKSWGWPGDHWEEKPWERGCMNSQWGCNQGGQALIFFISLSLGIHPNLVTSSHPCPSRPQIAAQATSEGGVTPRQTHHLSSNWDSHQHWLLTGYGLGVF